MSTDSFAERAYQQLRAALADGRLATGEPLPEGNLGAMLRMSRTPVREALLQLELEGYVVRDETARLVVHRLTRAEVADMFVVRDLLEAEAVRLAATRISDEELASLDRLVVADQRALRRRRFDELAMLNDEIHTVIMVASRNRTLCDLLRNLRSRILGLNAFAIGTVDDQQVFVEEHATLVELLRDGDGQPAVALLQDHLGRAREVLLRGLEEGVAS